MKKTHPEIESFTKLEPMIYAYDLPGVEYRKGWIKIGYTDKQTPKARINQQTGTAGIEPHLLWKHIARYTDNSGVNFRDIDFHAFLEIEKGVKRLIVNGVKKEWFEIDKHTSRDYFDEFAARGTLESSQLKMFYELREEQAEAVRKTREYFESGGKEFLWNAKPRFGKTLTSYDLVERMGFQKVLIVTNRPSIANAWAEDFHKFFAWRGNYCFVSETDSLRSKPGVITRAQYLARRLTTGKLPPMIAFVSLQDLKGSVYFGGKFDKLEWVSKGHRDNSGKYLKGTQFDLLIIDEAQEGVDTMRTDQAFENIARKHTLYLSGTPFKQLASAKYTESQIFNWSYADEQERKKNWTGEEYNPYENLPRLELWTYQMSEMIRERLASPNLDSEERSDFAFDMNEFFEVGENGRFVHETEVKKFLHALSTQEKYPFSTPERRRELSHTLWYFNRIKSVEAMEKLLKNDEVFKDYVVVKAVGDGSSNEDPDLAAKKNFDRVKKAVRENEKTITLTVGQLTVGVTVPEWSGVLMLCNLKSASAYMQAAFRAQNPCMFTDTGGNTFRKEASYIFDFDPARTLIIFDEFANNLRGDTAGGGGTTEDRKENIRRLLNFFPVIAEDDQGTMAKLDAAAVLSIPRKLKSQEVVRSGFMCNYLFNIGNVFGAPALLKEIIEKLNPAQEEKRQPNQAALDNMDEVSVDENGEVEIPREIVIGQAQNFFANPVYEDNSDHESRADEMAEEAAKAADPLAAMHKGIDEIAENVKAEIKEHAEPAVAEYTDSDREAQKLGKQVGRVVDRAVDNDFQKIKDDCAQQMRIAKTERDSRIEAAQSEKDIREANSDYDKRTEEILKNTCSAAKEQIQKTKEEVPQQVVERLEKNKAETKKRSAEEEIRAHLRGFSRSIPSFIMAYGDENLTLANFDDYTEDDVFLEVTGITEGEFRFLRDGGDWTNPETGETEYYEGHLFDETVFNDSIKEFLRKKEELANYFDENLTEDIFDYIPPQKTNQIFTPKWVVKKMVDMLEQENRGCFDDPAKTFADLYMKSGLYITEIVKRLYKSPKMKKAFPDDGDRIRHILRNQVYGMAPTRIIYLIAVNYILGFDETLLRPSRRRPSRQKRHPGGACRREVRGVI